MPLVTLLQQQPASEQPIQLLLLIISRHGCGHRWLARRNRNPLSGRKKAGNRENVPVKSVKIVKCTHALMAALVTALPHQKMLAIIQTKHPDRAIVLKQRCCLFVVEQCGHRISQTNDANAHFLIRRTAEHLINIWYDDAQQHIDPYCTKRVPKYTNTSAYRHRSHIQIPTLAKRLRRATEVRGASSAAVAVAGVLSLAARGRGGMLLVHNPVSVLATMERASQVEQIQQLGRRRA
jgi:hypothetical protein